VENQGAAYQPESEARSDERDQQSGSKARKDPERSASRHTHHTLGHTCGVRVGYDFVLEEVVRNIDAYE
jgi:hypothetical protein